MALVIIVQTGGQGIPHLSDYRGLDVLLSALVGDLPHRISVVSFDSTPHVSQDFTNDTDQVASTISALKPGDTGAAILDALTLGIDLLRKQPLTYRRAILLFSETVDNGSQTSFGNALRAVDDTNTSIYSFGFSSTKQP